MAAWTVEELRLELDRYEDELGAQQKPRNTVTSYVYPVDRFLRWLEEPYRPIRRAEARPPLTERRPLNSRDGTAGDGGRPTTEISSFSENGLLSRGGSRYDALRSHLSKRSEPLVHMSFGEIDRLIGQPGLPDSARRHRAWWANERSGSHSHARSWLGATPPRRTANVDFNTQTVDFVIEG